METSKVIPYDNGTMLAVCVVEGLPTPNITLKPWNGVYDMLYPPIMTYLGNDRVEVSRYFNDTEAR